MAKEEKPLKYEHRTISDTKSVVQRLDLDYLNKPSPFRDWKRKITWLAPVVAAAGILPFLTGIGSLDKAFSNGPVSRAHESFEKRCGDCHVKNFSSVPDAACANCHDGPAHPANTVFAGKMGSSPKCSSCHMEHRDNRMLSEVSDRNCTACHGNLAKAATGVTLKGDGLNVSGFGTGLFGRKLHPEFSTFGRTDSRPLKLNHKFHMDLRAEQNPMYKTMKLPMACGHCHATDTESPTGDLLVVNFEQHCRACHKEALGFVLAPNLTTLIPDANPAPHTGNVDEIRKIITDTYTAALAANPDLRNQRVGTGYVEPSEWLTRVIALSEENLFNGPKKCKQCHEYEEPPGRYPVVKKVVPILGQYAPGKAAGDPWLTHAKFSHRAHRAEPCATCHSEAVKSEKTADVLIPKKMAECTSCHGSSGTHLDRCSQCHLYHNKKEEKKKDRLPVDQLLSPRGKDSLLPDPHLFARVGGAH